MVNIKLSIIEFIKFIWKLFAVILGVIFVLGWLASWFGWVLPQSQYDNPRTYQTNDYMP